MLDNTARMIGTVGIWTSFAVVVAFGLCRMNFSDGGQFLTALFFVCVAVVLATAAVWFRSGKSHARSASVQPVAA